MAAFRKYTSGMAARRTLAEQTKQLYSHLPVSMLSTIVNGAVLVAILWENISHTLLFGWYITALLVSLIRYAACFIYRKSPQRIENVVFWFRLMLIGIGGGGLVWGAAGVLLFSDSITHQVFLAFVVAGMDDYISKPVNHDLLKAKLKAVAENRPAR